MDAVVPLSEIDAELPLTELYERVDFQAASRADESPDAAG